MLKKVGMSLLLVSTVLIASVMGTNNEAHNVQAADVCLTDDECDEQIREARNQLSALAEQEAAANDELEGVELDFTSTVEQISEMEKEINTIKSQIESVESNIQDNEEELAELDLQVEELHDIIAQRMRLSQRMNNNNVVLDVLTESESIVDFIRRVRIISHLSQSDAELMDELNTLVERQQEILLSLQTQKAELNEMQTQLEEDTIRLEAYKETLQQQKADLTERIRAIESEQLTAQDIIDIAEQQRNALSGNVVVPEVILPPGQTSGMFIRPMANGVVTCEFMCYVQHTGIDLSSSNRSEPILAAAAGTVSIAGWHNAFGNYIVITHNINGRTYTTLYAHLSSIHVSVGQTVAQGQQIGNMGSTGNSTGPHLHFEIYRGHFNWPHALDPRTFIHFPPQGVWW